MSSGWVLPLYYQVSQRLVAEKSSFLAVRAALGTLPCNMARNPQSSTSLRTLVKFERIWLSKRASVRQYAFSQKRIIPDLFVSRKRYNKTPTTKRNYHTGRVV